MLDNKPASLDKPSQEAVRAKRLSYLVDHTPLAIAMFDKNLHYIAASKKWLQVHRTEDTDFLGKSHYELTPRVCEYWKNVYARALTGEVLINPEDRVARDDGSVEWISWEVRPWYEEDKSIGGIMVFTEEVTDRKWAEEALWEAKESADKVNRLKSQFIANVSHEIRTPLNGIMGFSELTMNASSLEDAQSQAEKILEESESLLLLINALLDHAKIEAGELTIERQSFNLLRVMDNIKASARPHATTKNIELSVSITEDIPCFLLGDYRRIRQVMMNLINNAIKFTEAGRVDVRVERLSVEGEVQKLRFSVQDTGIGIPKDKQIAIFQSFKQLDDSATRKYGGTGLGIALSLQLVSLMGGQMDLESEPGKGSRFWFTIDLPASGKKEACQNISAATTAIHKTTDTQEARILVAEDYFPNQEVAHMMLESAGYKVDIANDGAQAVETCETTQYELILMDIQMPVMGGCEAATKIKEKSLCNAKTPILALTANADSRTMNNCRKAQMDGFIAKPIRRNSFLNAVENWISGEGEEDWGEGAAIPLNPPITSQNQGRAPINREEAIREFGDNEDLLESVLQGFLARANNQIKMMQTWADEKKYEELRMEAHKIKGGAANLTAMNLSNAAAKLEISAQEENAVNIGPALQECKKEFERVKNFLLT